MTRSPERLTAFDYGITPAACLRPAIVDIEVYDRPHRSPAMERALQRIETEIPARMRALRVERDGYDTPVSQRKAA